MLFWITVFLATAVMVALLLTPLLRRSAPAEGEHTHDVEVYRDQLKEVERDEAEGLISTEEAGYAKAEIGRRLIASAEKVETEKGGVHGRRHIVSAVFVIILLPVLGISLYLKTGDPGLPSQPLAERLQNPGKDVNLMIAKVEDHLIQHPNDGAGWDLIAPIYMRNMRADDAVDAFRNAIRLLGPNAARLSGLGEAIVVSNNGLVTSEAKDSFRKALEMDKQDARSEFYLAVALEQEGRSMEALAAFKSLAETSAPDAPWQPIVAKHVALLEKGPVAPIKPNPDAPGNPTAADVAAAKDMTAGDRQQMILNMVQGLDEKLKKDPNNFEGWMRLVRSYAMLKENAKASDALKRSLAAFPPDTDQGKQLLAMASQLGVSNEGAKQ